MTQPAYPRRSVTIRPSIAAMRADQGPAFEHYEYPLDGAGLYRFSPGSLLADDNWTTIVPLGGGTAGAWILVRVDDKGDDITAATTTLTVGGKRWRRCPTGVLVADISPVLSTVNAVRGDWLEITFEGPSAYSINLINGGPAAGTIVTLSTTMQTAGSSARPWFDGVNWKDRTSIATSL